MTYPAPDLDGLGNRPLRPAEEQAVRMALNRLEPLYPPPTAAWPLLTWVRPLPAALAGQAMLAVCHGLERAGFEAFYRGPDAVGRELWISRRPRPGGLPEFICPRCGASSPSLNDWQQGYCGACHDWTAPR